MTEQEARNLNPPVCGYEFNHIFDGKIKEVKIIKVIIEQGEIKLLTAGDGSFDPGSLCKTKSEAVAKGRAFYELCINELEESENKQSPC